MWEEIESVDVESEEDSGSILCLRSGHHGSLQVDGADLWLGAVYSSLWRLDEQCKMSKEGVEGEEKNLPSL